MIQSSAGEGLISNQIKAANGGAAEAEAPVLRVDLPAEVGHVTVSRPGRIRAVAASLPNRRTKM